VGVGSGEVEAMVIDFGFWRGRRVLLTGHTGFKGAWTSLILASMGAEVHGLALEPEDARGLFEAARLAELVRHRTGDIREPATVERAMAEARPEVVIHLAAQALVRPSYIDPVGTYATNVMGTVHLLEAARRQPEIRAVLVVTSDKCYENTGSLWGYREPDAMGGHDPYSNSKGCAELVTSAYRRSFFHGDESARVATARAGNVIGGGDWAVDRIVPDAMRAFAAGRPLRVRNPAAVRPWQHVLDPVLAYIGLAEMLASAGGEGFAEGWNFGPAAASEVPVRRIVEGLAQAWGDGARWEHDGGEHPHEAAYLKLDCTKAAAQLGWRPVIGLDDALRMTVEWYRALEAGKDMRSATLDQIDSVLGRLGAEKAGATAAAQ
jgi:CDP-glucose 4,6-dehydratase